VEIAGPDLAAKYTFIEEIREIIIRAAVLSNIVIGLVFGLAVFFLVCGITLFSPGLKWKH
jgi:hypothetical protein